MDRCVIPVTLELACALEDAGDLFSLSARVMAAHQGAGGLLPIMHLLVDVLDPLMTLGAIAENAQGIKKMDRQAVLDFATALCGLTRADAWQRVTLRELSLQAQRLGVAGHMRARPDAEFLATMLNAFDDRQGQKS